jgi:hypothetical protein
LGRQLRAGGFAKDQGAAGSLATGRILSMRPVAAPAAGGLLWAVLLAGSDSSDQGAAEEFIVRTDDGTILSIVQSNESGFHAGDRVLILYGGPTRLTWPG